MESSNTAYIIGVALGDGNLSNPNGRSVRLRITCDTKYPDLIFRIQSSLQSLLPNNKVSLVHRTPQCVDISCYSKEFERILGWKADYGSKFAQKARVPAWIFTDSNYVKACLKGLIETDGSIFMDRGYTHVNFTTTIPELAEDVNKLFGVISYTYSVQRVVPKSLNSRPKYVFRVCKRSREFIKELNLNKS